jgi:hypothetical protein
MMNDFDLPDVQPTVALENLVRFACEVGVCHIVYSVAKITRPRLGALPPVMEKMRRVYEHLSPGIPLVSRGGSWRLASDVAERLVVSPFLNLCRQYAIEAKVCKENLISTL